MTHHDPHPVPPMIVLVCALIAVAAFLVGWKFGAQRQRFRRGGYLT